MSDYNCVMAVSQIHKLYLSNFLAGLVFWFGIEKLFMTSIGIDAIGIGIATAVLTVLILIFDIPSGIIADKWSRKGLLIISAIALAFASLICGLSSGLPWYIVGEVFYGLFVVTTSGTYQAITYDTLKEQGNAKSYSRIIGRAYALFLVGGGIGDVVGGFLAGEYGYRFVFYVSIATCILNALLLSTLKEPSYHKDTGNQKILKQLGAASKALIKIRLIKALTIVLSVLAVVEVFKLEFGQLYMLRYVDTPQVIGSLWAVFAFSMALGSIIAHRFRARLSALILVSTIPLVAMSVLDSRINLALFMVQAIAGAALINQIETRVQENTPSEVRASVLSVLSSLGRMVSVPAVLMLGYIFKNYDGLLAIRLMASLAVIALVYWFFTSVKIKSADKPVKAVGDF